MPGHWVAHEAAGISRTGGKHGCGGADSFACPVQGKFETGRCTHAHHRRRTGSTSAPGCLPTGSPGSRLVSWNQYPGRRSLEHGRSHSLFKDGAQLVESQPDALLAGVGATIVSLAEATKTIPIVFAQGLDPLGEGYIDSLARPGGNITGFNQMDFSVAGKWMELLKEISPNIDRVAVLREPGGAGIGQWAIIQSVAQSVGVELKPISSTNAATMEREVSRFASSSNGGLIVVVSASGLIHRDLIVSLAERYRLPAAYAYRVYVAHGGLLTYSTDISSQYRRAAGYVDRILKGEKPGDLPVQSPTKYNLVINLKTAKTLGLTVPPSLLARADEVIE
jgi:putative tryptophan/tyrosine transport system substrate-binding protein